MKQLSAAALLFAFAHVPLFADTANDELAHCKVEDLLIRKVDGAPQIYTDELALTPGEHALTIGLDDGANGPYSPTATVRIKVKEGQQCLVHAVTYAPYTRARQQAWAVEAIDTRTSEDLQTDPTLKIRNLRVGLPRYDAEQALIKASVRLVYQFEHDGKSYSVTHYNATYMVPAGYRMAMDMVLIFDEGNKLFFWGRFTENLIHSQDPLIAPLLPSLKAAWAQAIEVQEPSVSR